MRFMVQLRCAVIIVHRRECLELIECGEFQRRRRMFSSDVDTEFLEESFAHCPEVCVAIADASLCLFIEAGA